MRYFSQDNIGLWDKLAYSFGILGKNIAHGVICVVLLIYSLQVLHLSFSFLVTTSLFSLLVESAFALFIGLVFDNFKKPIAKYMLWPIVGTVLTIASTLTYLFLPELIASPSRCHYALLLIVINCCIFLIQLPYIALISSFSSNARTRSLIATMPNAANFVGRQFIFFALLGLLAHSQSLNWHEETFFNVLSSIFALLLISQLMFILCIRYHQAHWISQPARQYRRARSRSDSERYAQRQRDPSFFNLPSAAQRYESIRQVGSAITSSFRNSSLPDSLKGSSSGSSSLRNRKQRTAHLTNNATTRSCYHTQDNDLVSVKADGMHNQESTASTKNTETTAHTTLEHSSSENKSSDTGSSCCGSGNDTLYSLSAQDIQGSDCLEQGHSLSDLDDSTAYSEAVNSTASAIAIAVVDAVDAVDSDDYDEVATDNVTTDSFVTTTKTTKSEQLQSNAYYKDNELQDVESEIQKINDFLDRTAMLNLETSAEDLVDAAASQKIEHAHSGHLHRSSVPKTNISSSQERHTKLHAQLHEKFNQEIDKACAQRQAELKDTAENAEVADEKTEITTSSAIATAREQHNLEPNQQNNHEMLCASDIGSSASLANPGLLGLTRAGSSTRTNVRGLHRPRAVRNAANDNFRPASLSQRYQALCRNSTSQIFKQSEEEKIPESRYRTRRRRVSVRHNYSEQKLQLSHIALVLIKNDQLMLMFLIGIIQYTGFSLMSSLLFQFFIAQDMTNNIINTICLAMGIICQITSILMYPKVAQDSRRSKVWINSNIILCITFVIHAFLQHINSDFIYLILPIIFLVFNASMGLTKVALTSMVADTVDYGEFKLSMRNDALVFAYMSVSMRLGLFISGVFFFNSDMSDSVYSSVKSVMPVPVDIIFEVLLICSMLLIILYMYKIQFKLNGAFYRNVLNNLQFLRQSQRHNTRYLVSTYIQKNFMLRYSLDIRTVIVKLKATNENEMIQAMVQKLNEVNAITSEHDYMYDLRARLALGPCGIAEGIAIPHAKSSAVNRATVVVATLDQPLDLGAMDGKECDLIFLLASPDDGVTHMNLLGRLSLLLNEPNFADKLRTASSSTELFERLIKCEKNIVR